jgi:hypothetical protein
MYKAVDVAELKFDGCPHIVESGDATMFPDNLEPTLQTALMVVSHLEDEKVFEDVSVHFYIFSILYFPVLDSQINTKLSEFKYALLAVSYP